MSKRNVKQFIPTVYRNNKIDSFLDSTTETLFTKKESSKISQYIGRTSGGVYNPVKDNYVPEIRKTRADYQLEPSLVNYSDSKAIDTVFTYEDLLNSLKYSGSDITDQSRIFTAQTYSFAPPIDTDMFINSKDYYWYPEGIPAIPFNTSPSDITGKIKFTGFVNGDPSDEHTVTSGNHLLLNDGKEYIVEGVGKYIELLEFDLEHKKPLRTPFTNNTLKNILEQYPVEYITMDRGSYDGNVWSRHNAWYHKDSIAITNKLFSNKPDIKRRANRPIVCFSRHIELFNYGIYKTWVHYKLPELNKTNLKAGDRLIVDLDNRVYEYDGITFNVIETLKYKDMVSIIGSEHYKQEFYWDIHEIDNVIVYNYTLAQSKNRPTEYIRFNLYDSSNMESANLLSDELLYPSSNFKGCRLFGYVEDDLYGIYDRVLGLNVSYKTQTSDSSSIVYKNFTTTRNTYIDDKGDTVEFNKKFYKLHNPKRLPTSNIFKFTIGANKDINSPRDSSVYVNGKHLDTITVRGGVDYVFDYSDTSTTKIGWKGKHTPVLVYRPSNNEHIILPTHGANSDNIRTHRFTFDESNNDNNIFEYTDNTSIGRIVVVKNTNEPVSLHTMWCDLGKVKPTLYAKRVITDVDNNKLELSMIPSSDDLIFTINGVTQTKSRYTLQNKTIVPRNKLKKHSYLECTYKTNHTITTDIEDVQVIPSSLSSNSWNEDPTTFTYSDIFQHLVSNIANQDGLDGSSLTTNNYRDTTRNVGKGDVIVKTEDPLSLTMFTLFDDKRMPTDAIELATKYYDSYKLSLIINTEEYTRNNIVNSNNTSTSFDAITQLMNNNKTKSDSYATSRMFAAYNKFTSVTIDDDGFFSSYIDMNDNNCVYVYTTNGLVVNGRDYNIISDISTQTSKIEYITFTHNNIVSIRYYIDIEPTYCPATPAKFGLVKTYYPEIVKDSTYSSDQYFIKGHDGSKTPCFSTVNEIESNNLHANDLILLEFERRVYNNIDTKFKSNGLPLLESTIKAGKYRNTEYSTDEYNTVMFNLFNNWIFDNEVEYRVNSGYMSNDPFTYNYSSLVDKDGIKLQGNWRGIYLYYFDTTTPHITPWEMLGFNSKPTWWETTYGSDYASSNTNMWDDIEKGIIRHGNRTNIRFSAYLGDNPYRRIGLSENLPVDIYGRLLDPIAAGICGIPDGINAMTDWKFGDVSPVEFSWMNTSNYLFDTVRAYFNLFPSKFIGRAWDTNNSVDVLAGSITPVKKINVHSNNEYVSGLSQWIYDLLIHNQYDTSAFIQSFNTFDLQLAHKVGGFIDSSELQIISESYSPDSISNSSSVPFDDITTLIHESKDINKVEYSGISIVRVRPFGEIYNYKEGFDYKRGDVAYIESERTYYENIGKISHSKWEFSTFYEVGRIATFNNNVYVCNTAHRANSNNIPELLTVWSLRPFNQSEWKVLPKKPASKTTYFKVAGYSNTHPYFYSILPQDGSATKTVTVLSERSRPLPSVEGSEVEYTHSKKLSYPVQGGDRIQRIPYNHVFKSEQEVVEFMAGYSRYLESIGFMFDDFNKERNKYNNWALAIEEFMSWSIDNKSENSLIILSPAESKIKFNPKHGVVSAVKEVDNGVYNVLTYTGDGLTPDMLNVTRNNNVFQLTADLPIYFCRLKTREYEHIITINNVSIFNDIMFHPLFNIRKQRLLLRVEKSGNWDGRLKADGFIIDNNRLIPNFETSISDIRTVTDVDAVATQDILNTLKYHNIGYQSREHLSNLGMSDVSQIKFYQGFAKQKGTSRSYQNILRNGVIGADEQMTISEEWAFKQGSFGTVTNNQSVEILIDTNDIKTLPQVIVLDYKQEILNKKPEYVYANYADRAKWVGTPTSFYDDTNIFPTIKLDKVKVFETAGYVHWDEANVKAFNLEHINKNLFKSKVKPQDARIWVANDDNANDTWNVYKIADITLPYEILDIYTTGEEGLTSAIVTLDDTYYDRSVYGIFDNGINKTFELYPIGEDQHILIPFDDSFLILPEDTQKEDIKFSKCFSMRINKNIHKILPDINDTIDSFITTTGLPIVNNDILYVDDDGSGDWAVVKYQNMKWTVIRKEREVIDIERFSESLLYNIDKNDVITNLPYHDPIKGLIAGSFLSQIDYVTGYDPVEYKVASFSTFTKSQLGKLWLDTSKIRYIEYEANSIEYRSRFWGTLFPDSSVDVYEWTRSTVSPEKQSVSEQAQMYDFNTFIKDRVYDNSLGVEIVYYYYWVKNAKTIPENNKRTVSASEVASSIRYPESNTITYCSVISNESVTISDYAKQLTDLECILQLNYKISDADFKTHNQWILVDESVNRTDIPAFLTNKMIDSLLGYTDIKSINGVKDISTVRQVPDNTLPEILKYGNENNPRQSWFKDQKGARRIFVEQVNNFLINISWSNIELLYGRTGLPMDTGTYELVDWFDTTFIYDKPISVMIDSNRRLQSANASVGDYIKVIKSNGDIDDKYVPDWVVYKKGNNDSFTKVAESDGAMQITSIVSTLETLTIEQSLALRKFIDVLYDRVFIKPYDTEINNIFFSMVRFVFNDQVSNNWVFPTTYINVNQTVNLFGTSPVFAQEMDKQITDYIEEAKPYHTKIRAFNKVYKGGGSTGGDGSDSDFVEDGDGVEDEDDTMRNTASMSITDYDKRPYIDYEGDYDKVVSLQEDIIDTVTTDGSLVYTLKHKHRNESAKVYVNSVIVTMGDYVLDSNTITFNNAPALATNSVANITVISPNYTDISKLSSDKQNTGYMSVNQGKPDTWEGKVRKNTIKIIYDRVSTMPTVPLEELLERFDTSRKTETPMLSLHNESYTTDVIPFTQADRVAVTTNIKLLRNVVEHSSYLKVPNKVPKTYTLDSDLTSDNIRVFIDEKFISKHYYTISKPSNETVKIKFNMTLYYGQVLSIRSKEHYDTFYKKMVNFKDGDVDYHLNKSYGIEWNTKVDSLVSIQNGVLTFDSKLASVLANTDNNIVASSNNNSFGQTTEKNIVGNAFTREPVFPEELSRLNIKESTIISSINAYPKYVENGYDSTGGFETFRSLSFSGNGTTTEFDLVDVNVPVEQILVIVNDDRWLLNSHYTIDTASNKITFIKVPNKGTNNIVVTDGMNGFDTYTNGSGVKGVPSHLSGYDGIRVKPDSMGQDMREYIVYADDGKEYFLDSIESSSTLLSSSIDDTVKDIPINSLPDRSTHGLASIHATQYKCVNGKRIVTGSSIEFVYFSSIKDNVLMNVHRGVFGTRQRNFDINTHEVKVYILKFDSKISSLYIEEPFIGTSENNEQYPKMGHIFLGTTELGDC